jgi:hypothetical protein
MKRVPTIAAAALMAATLAACNSHAKATGDPSSRVSRKGTPTSSSASPSTTQTSSSSDAKATSLDPCHLVTREEASALANATFGPGLEQGPRTARRCVYGAQTANVLTVVVAAASSDAAAQAHWDRLLTEAQQGLSEAPAGSVKLTPQSGLADRAEWVELDLSAVHVSARGLAFLDGNVGVYMIDLVRDAPAPSRPALTQQAQTVLSRLP